MRTLNFTKAKKMLFFSWVFLAIFLGGFCYLYHITNPSNNQFVSLSDNRFFIAHATGSLEGYKYLNSKESLLSTLENGYKYSEIDLQYTADSVLVCVHNWEEFNKASITGINGKDTLRYRKTPSYEEFKSRKIYGKYTPLSLTDVLEIQSKIPFVIVTDNICDANALNKYIGYDKRRNVMVEAFTKKDYIELDAAGYTPMLSIGCINRLECLSFIIDNIFGDEIRWIAVECHSSDRCLRLLKKIFNLNVAMFTVNSPTYLKWHLGREVDLIYTDNWNLKTLINNYQDNTTH